MTESVGDFEARQLATAAGQALKKMIQDSGFAQQVVEDPKTALADFNLSDDQVAALAADAPHLVLDEVAGFSSPMPPLKTSDMLGIRPTTFSYYRLPQPLSIFEIPMGD